MSKMTLEPTVAPPVADRIVPAECRAEWWSQPDWTGLLPLWRKSHRRYSPRDLGADPDWCRGVEEEHPGRVQFVVVRYGGESMAVVPMLLKPIELDCHLGEVMVARFRPRVLQLAGGLPGLPEKDEAYAAFFAALLAHRERFDALRFAAPTASRLWRFLGGAEVGHGCLRRYEPSPPVAHHFIRLPESFSAYVAKFTPKTRKNRFRELKYLEARGAVELVRYSRPEQVEAFLAEAQAISRRSYQHKLLNAGLRAPEQIRHRLQIAATQGWLRSYVLRCGGVACSYMLGYQYQGRYRYTKVGYDPAWKSLCVGTVLQLLVLQELYEFDTPREFDFGAQGPQKQYFGNEQYEEGVVYFFKRRPYPWLARWAYHASRRATARAGDLLSRHNLKPQVQRLVRRARGC